MEKQDYGILYYFLCINHYVITSLSQQDQDRICEKRECRVKYYYVLCILTEFSFCSLNIWFVSFYASLRKLVIVG